MLTKNQESFLDGFTQKCGEHNVDTDLVKIAIPGINMSAKWLAMRLLGQRAAQGLSRGVKGIHSGTQSIIKGYGKGSFDDFARRLGGDFTGSNVATARNALSAGPPTAAVNADLTTALQRRLASRFLVGGSTVSAIGGGVNKANNMIKQREEANKYRMRGLPWQR